MNIKPNRPSNISYEHATELSIEDHFDCSSETWKQPFQGPLWSVVSHAQRSGLSGKDRTVAVIDSGFDLGINRLNVASLGSCAQESQVGGSVQHGTLVALLINEIAPEATLDLYEVSMAGEPSAMLIEKALQEIEKSEADIVNLSLGHSTEQDGPETCNCTLASSVARLSQLNKLAIAACGNEFGPLACPAQQQSVLSVGYRGERREIEWDDGVPVREIAMADRPDFAQAMLANVVVKQPPDIAGSSFAAPMVCGLAALSPPLTQLAELCDVLRRAASASEMTAFGDPELQALHPWEEPFNAIRKFPAAEPSPLLSWMTHWMYINYAQYLMNQNYDQALEQANIAVKIAPWSDNAWSMLAGINMHLTDDLDLTNKEQRAEAVEYLQKAVHAYDQTLVIHGKHELYSYWREHCLKRLTELSA